MGPGTRSRALWLFARASRAEPLPGCSGSAGGMCGTGGARGMGRPTVAGVGRGDRADKRAGGKLGLREFLIDLIPELTEGSLRRVEPQAVPETTVAADILDLSGTQRAKALNHEHTSSYLFGTGGGGVEPRARYGASSERAGGMADSGSGGWTRTTDSAIMSRLLCL